jgi:exosortase A
VVKPFSISRLSVLVLLLAGVYLYAPMARKLIRDWANDDNYSHGFFIVPLALFFAWERRGRLLQAARQPVALGLVVVIGSLGLLVAGTLGAELFLTRVSLIGTLGGTVLFLYGWAFLRALAFPLLFLLLMVPIPAIVFNQIAFPLQLVASRFGASALSACSIPVLREGNVIVLANTTLEVAEACSGIRSLVSLLTLALVYGYFMDSRWWVRAVVAISAVPIAIIANGLRVAGTGVAAHLYGPEAAQGFFHTFSGWLVFGVAFVMLLALSSVIRWIAGPDHPKQGSGAPAQEAVA